MFEFEFSEVNLSLRGSRSNHDGCCAGLFGILTLVSLLLVVVSNHLSNALDQLSPSTLNASKKIQKKVKNLVLNVHNLKSL